METTHVDMAFSVSGRRLPRDHSAALWVALAHALPWLEDEDELAVFPVRAAAISGGSLVINRRSRLVLRLRAERVRGALELCGRTIEVGGESLVIGKAMTRALIPHGTIYAHRVAARDDDEAAFARQVAEELDAFAVRGDFITGKRSSAHGPSGDVTGFSVMLTALRPPESTRLQVAGLGPHRKLGFGVFVPHRSTAAVGSDEAAAERRAIR
jgi:CRISPR-associated protein Cas6